MQKINLRIVLLTLLGALFITNCEDIVDDSVVSPEDSLAALVLINDANALLLPLLADLLVTDPDSGQAVLNSIDLSGPNNFYSEALELDWRNEHARFGVGFTSFLIVSQSLSAENLLGSSVKVYAPFSDGDSNPFGYGFGLPLSETRVNGMISTYFQLPLAFANMKFEMLDAFNDLQTITKNEYLPMVEAGLTALDSLDNDTEYSFTLSAGIVLDIADILAMEASLSAAQGILKTLLAYNYELDTEDPAAIISGLTLGSQFGTLQEDGLTLLSDAYVSAQNSLDFTELALSYIEAGAGPAAHFLVDYTLASSSQDRVALNALLSALNSPTDVEYGFADERGEISVDGTITMDVDQFYLNPHNDMKTLLPSYTVETTTAYNYNQVSLEETVSLEEPQVLVAGLNNTPVSITFMYSESNADTVASVSLGFIGFNLLTANQGDLPTAIWDLWAEFLVIIDDYSDEAHNFPEIYFEWNGVVTTGESLIIDGDFTVDYLERTGSYTVPDLLWDATTYPDWVDGWSNPTVNGLFPDFNAEDLAGILGITWE